MRVQSSDLCNPQLSPPCSVLGEGIRTRRLLSEEPPLATDSLRLYARLGYHDRMAMKEAYLNLKIGD